MCSLCEKMAGGGARIACSEHTGMRINSINLICPIIVKITLTVMFLFAKDFLTFDLFVCSMVAWLIVQEFMVL